MSIYLIRHGETAFNVARVFQPADTPLSERGVAQAQALAKRLASMGVTDIVSSDLPRALRTAQEISATTGAPIETTALLHEKNFGDWRGKPYDGMGFNPMTMLEAPPGGESMLEFQQRVARAFELVAKRRATTVGNLAVVTHGLVLREMLSKHARVLAHMRLPAQMDNTSISVIDASSPFEAALLNCTLHLEGATLADPKGLSGG
jgi:2,3-bisphosphoglycerate-dependent phosphoglycerate mutase